MTYPLNMRNASVGGYAVANTEAEHRALSDMGYEPKFEAPDVQVSEDAPVKRGPGRPRKVQE